MKTIRKRLVALIFTIAMIASLSILPASAATGSFTLRTSPDLTGSERVYSQTLVVGATSKNAILVQVSSFYRNGSGNGYATCTSHTTTSPVSFTSAGSYTIKVSSNVVKGTVVTVEMSLKNYSLSETITTSGTVGS